MRRAVLFAIVFLTGFFTGCVKYPEPYRPPIQRRPMEFTQPGKLAHFVAMSSPGAPEHFLRDVVPTLMDNNWRWTLKSPTFQFQTPTTQGLRLQADITVAEVTFEQTGPVTITAYVGERLLDTIEFKKPEHRTWEKAVPPEWLATDRPVVVRLEIDKIWTSPADGVKRGFILQSIGFVQ